MANFDVIHHLPIHFDPEVGQTIREVKMWSYILVIISAMTIFSNVSYLGSTGHFGNGLFDGILNAIEAICSLTGLYIGQLGLKSTVTVDINTIRQYVFYLTILAGIMIILRVLWVADVILLAKKDLKERSEEEEENKDDDDDDENKDTSENQYFDDYYSEENQMSDHKFLIYFGIQASLMAIIVISMWITCVLRAYRLRSAVESFEGIATRA